MYQLKFFQPIPSDYQNDGSRLWMAIQDALDNNHRGPNGTQRILSIVANKFTYSEIQANLKVSFLSIFKIIFVYINNILYKIVLTELFYKTGIYGRNNLCTSFCTKLWARWLPMGKTYYKT